MTSAHRLAEDYFRRTSCPADTGLDAAFAYQRAVLRDLLTRLEVILEDEGIPGPTTERVIRCLLYGSPSPADAELRIRQHDEMIQLMQRLPSDPAVLPAGLLGMQPR